MLCKFSMLRRKEVINLCDGCRLGCVGDLDVQVPEGTVKGIIVFGPCRFFIRTTPYSAGAVAALPAAGTAYPPG